MEKLTKERKLAREETYIKNLILSNNKCYVDAFNFIHDHYLLDYLLGKSNYFSVFKAIYIENITLPKWKLAQYCNVSRTTLFDYRKDIIRCFHTYINTHASLDETALTIYNRDKFKILN